MTTPALKLASVLAGARCILLDFDGPVCHVFAGHPAPVVARELVDLAGRHGVIVSAGGGPHTVMRAVWDRSPEVGAVVERALTAAEVKAAATAAPTPGTDALLTVCAAAGLPVAVVSNNAADAIEAYLERHDLRHLVDVVEGRPEHDPTLMKPHPDLLRRALEHLDVPAEAAVFVGDSTTDIDAGRRAGVRTIGYANKSGKAAMFVNVGADALITSMTALSDLVCELPAVGDGGRTR